MTEPLPISQSTAGPIHWHPAADAARLLNVSERQVRRRCGDEWLAAGLARVRDGKWEVRSDADPILAITPGSTASNLIPPRLLETAARRLAILNRWQQAKVSAGSLNMTADQATDHFLAQLKKESGEDESPISRRTLYNWSADYQRNGIAGLVDARSQRRQVKARHDDPFLTYVRHLYEHENKRTIRWCHDHALLKAQEMGEGWVISSYAATKRYLHSLPAAELIARRQGPKAFNDQCVGNIDRYYEGLRANEVWVSDHHQFDVIVKIGERLNAQTGEAEPVFARPWLTAWMDCRSRKLVAWRIRAEDPASDVIIETLRRGCQTHGVPEAGYTDNGKDFDCKALTGITKGARRRKLHVEHDQVKIGGIFAALGAQHMRAWKFHGQSKPIERFFLTACLRFSVEFETYCGNSVDNKPESLWDHMGVKGRIERGLAPDLAEFTAAFDSWVEHDYHQRFHRGDGMDQFTGPAQAWESCLVTKRVADPQLLDLLCQPVIGPLSVTADGITVHGIQYGRGQLTAHFGRKVCVRLRDTVDSVSVWSTDDKDFLGVIDANQAVPFRATQEQLKAAIKEKRSDARKLRESWLPSLRKHESVTDRMRRRANTALPLAVAPDPDPYRLQPLRSDLEQHLNALSAAEESAPLRKAVGAESLSMREALSAYGGGDE